MSDHKSTILIVDDERLNLDILVELLKTDYRTLVAKDGEQALKRAVSASELDLILLDVMMPGIDGYEVCRRLKADEVAWKIPVIFITTKGEAEDEEHGLKLGAVDYITKPFSPAIVKARVETHIKLKKALEALENQNRLLEQKVEERTQEVNLTRDVAIHGMASLAEARDYETGNHIWRTQHYVKCLAEKLRDHPRFRHYLSDTVINTLFKSAPLHDIGKVGIPDHILLKPDKLSADEFELMKKHVTIGRDAILKAEQKLGTSTFLDTAREIAYTHQEKWDGSGYPQGLKEDEIPIAGRLMAVADVYDALINKRHYKPALPHHEAVNIICNGRGQHFDPDIVDAFVEISEEFRNIAEKYADD